MTDPESKTLKPALTDGTIQGLSWWGRIKQHFIVLREILLLIHANRKWWLIPILMVFGFLGFFLTFFGGSSILPAIYVLF